MKPMTFQWGWNGAAPQPDPAMSRQRAATLLRSWRRSARYGGPYSRVALTRVSKGQYRVASHGEVGLMITS